VSLQGYWFALYGDKDEVLLFVGVASLLASASTLRNRPGNKPVLTNRRAIIAARMASTGTLLDVWAQAAESTQETLKSTGQGMMDASSQAAQSTQETLKNTGHGMMDTSSQAAHSTQDTLKSAGQTVVDSLKGVGQAIDDTSKDMAKGAKQMMDKMNSDKVPPPSLAMLTTYDLSVYLRVACGHLCCVFIHLQHASGRYLVNFP
jgi:ElaB/YqjD/DUF883 family membrane-anchored ribosome-binding protein